VYSDIAEDVRDDFLEFISGFDTRGWGDDFKDLQDYLNEWLDHRSDTIINEAGGDFATYLLGLVLIFDAYLRDPSILDYHVKGARHERRVSGVIDMDSGRSGAACIDPDRFRQRVFRLLRGQASS
jgi:hypothetical protein